MSDTEKITINIGPVDLGRIDLLVDQGVYTNRTDLIRTAIRNQVERHAAVVDDTIIAREYSVGIHQLTKKGLESRRDAGERLRLRVIGMVGIAGDVDPDLARETIDSIMIHGVFRAPSEVRDALAGRVNKGVPEE